MALGFNGIPWSNFRGYCYGGYENGAPPEPVTTVVPTWKGQKSFPIKTNFCRIDWGDWGGFYDGDQFFNPGRTFPNPTAVQQFKQVLIDQLNAFDAAGIFAVFNGAFSGQGLFSLPSLRTASAGPTGAAWYSNSNYPGTEAAYQGMKCWDACWQGFTLPLLQIMDSHPCVVGYKLENEPGQGGELSQVADVNTALRNVGNFFGQKMRAFGSKKPIVFQTYGENAASGRTSPSDMQQVAPSSTFGPFLFSIHYPDPNATSVANCTVMNMIQGAIAGVPGLQGWYIDEATGNGWSDDVHLQACKQFGIPGPLAFDYRSGSLLDSSANPTAECLFVSSQGIKWLGQPSYFTGSPPPPPPPTPTTLTLTARVV